MSQFQSLLDTRIELRTCHLREWDMLTIAQKKVWQLISEETDRKLFINRDDKLACIDLKRKQFVELTLTIANQREEREQMKVRHRQQIAALG